MKQGGRVIVSMMAAFLSGCTTFKVKHEVPPIYATVDVNIHIQEQLRQVFDYEEPRSRQVAGTSRTGGQ